MIDRRTIRRWLPFAAAVVLFFALYGWDTQLKKPTGPGFVPSDADWTVAAANVGAFWAGLANTPAYHRIEDAGLRPVRAFERYVYRRTAVRPNATRWNVWLGRQGLAGGRNGQWGLCTRPGVLLRAASWIHGMAGGGDGVRRYGDLHYAWRDGYFIVSPDAGYVQACLDAEPTETDAALGSDIEAVVRWGGNAYLRIEAAPGLPVTGQLDLDVTPREYPLRLADAWPNDAILTAGATHWRDLAAVYERAAEPMRAFAPFQPAAATDSGRGPTETGRAGAARRPSDRAAGSAVAVSTGRGRGGRCSAASTAAATAGSDRSSAGSCCGGRRRGAGRGATIVPPGRAPDATSERRPRRDAPTAGAPAGRGDQWSRSVTGAASCASCSAEARFRSSSATFSSQ
ncbi:MAG: hypothetical protein ACF8XB_05500 [Planctomycetota bacterium JB042]